MESMSKRWLAAPLVLSLVVVACGGDDAEDPTEEAAEPAAEATEAAEAPAGSAAATVMLGDEELTIDRTLCYFEEQPRAGLGGVWTHTSQATGANAAGEPVVIGLDRARSEEGEVGDSIYVDIGEPGADDAVGFTASGPEGLIEFGDDSVSAQDVEVAVFGSDPVALSVQFDC